MDTLTVEMVCL